MSLEEPLGLIENHQRLYRHPENYSVTIFGTPGRLPVGLADRGPPSVAQLHRGDRGAVRRDAGVLGRQSRRACRTAIRWPATARSGARPICRTR